MAPTESAAEPVPRTPSPTSPAPNAVDKEAARRDEAAAAPIAASAFFGASHRVFRAPALTPGVARAAVHRARTADPAHRVARFATQAAAFAYCDARPGHRLRAWAYEVGTGGQRRFVAASYEAFWRAYSRLLRRGSGAPPHFYEVVRDGFAARLYVDLEFLWADNAALTKAHADQMVCAIVAACEGEANLTPGDGDALVLDSTTERKFSRHVIFRRIAFGSNVAMGDFMHRVVARVCSEERNLVMVRDADGNDVPFVDLAVYTRNRCFRLAGSSKFRKNAALVVRHSDGAAERLTRATFFASLVCNVRDGAKFVDGGRRVSSDDADARVGSKRVRASADGGFRSTGSANSPYQKLDAYVLSIVQDAGGGIYTANVLGGGRETVVYAIKGGYKWCGKVGRHHRSNNVMLVADVGARLMHQKCFDADCRGYRSPAWDIPPSVFETSGAADDAEADEEMDEDTLVRAVVEAERGLYDVSGGVSDEALVAMLGAVEADSRKN